MNPTFKTLNDAADPTFNQLLGINGKGRLPATSAAAMWPTGIPTKAIR